MLAGMTYGEIGAHPKVGLSLGGVQLAIERGMAAGEARRADLLDSALDVYTERSEALWTPKPASGLVHPLPDV